MGNEHDSDSGFLHNIDQLWRRLPSGFRWNLEDSFKPEDVEERLLPNEEPVLQINLAWYRDIFGHVVFHYMSWLILTTFVTTAVVGISAFFNAFPYSYALIPVGVLIAFTLFGIYERIEYSQWRLLKTNARLIISIPQHGAFPLVDNIELKGVPTVLDTNWSKNPFWRFFQFFTGARDLYISLAAYRFVEGTARVGDALIIPDVMPRDVYALKKVVFSVPSKPKPQNVVFPTPQKVIFTQHSPEDEE